MRGVVSENLISGFMLYVRTTFNLLFGRCELILIPSEIFYQKYNELYFLCNQLRKIFFRKIFFGMMSDKKKIRRGSTPLRKIFQAIRES
ncbi:MAG: hypothetical protein CVV24_01035 [Ignavibacteriae bacterium HGW-Ignavibacteriae-3]|nr:MAG: hypothetical protein CVV24_01035 [Ignavibacteriae bacterium HGW-Ignavibacteriae-3]